ncbi:helix-turn-helix domain-containing protein [Bacillus circulans]|uniref:helix-turn-helix domain-containing protein n=1 Tax=Niallia circulans TaxID=1397 RepID=UPI00156172BA|nr:helix-turn-helix domain-containing protein [Niallia circulans]NRG29172.1 helix-turn-helix domain-containing protein [Niallia circulans]
MKNSKVGFIKFNASLMNDYKLKMGETLVYGALVSFRNMSIQFNTKDEKGEVYAYPPISSIAKITGQSERSVKSHIQALEKKELMTVERSYKEGGKEKNVNRYYLDTEVLRRYFTAEAIISSEKTSKTIREREKLPTNESKSRQDLFINDTKIEKWFTHYQGEHNNNSAKKLNKLAEKYGSETVVKAIHNAMNGVNIDTLPQGTTGLILSRLTDKNLIDAKIQLKKEKETQERFMNEPVTPHFDYKAALSQQKKEDKTIVDDMKALLGEVI